MSSGAIIAIVAIVFGSLITIMKIIFVEQPKYKNKNHKYNQNTDNDELVYKLENLISKLENRIGVLETIITEQAKK